MIFTLNFVETDKNNPKIVVLLYFASKVLQYFFHSFASPATSSRTASICDPARERPSD